jgi:cytochrome d ubiquinol oxidase subunit II
VSLLWALAGGTVLLFPALYVLFRVFKGERPFAVVDRAARR